MVMCLGWKGIKERTGGQNLSRGAKTYRSSWERKTGNNAMEELSDYALTLTFFVNLNLIWECGKFSSIAYRFLYAFFTKYHLNIA